MVPYRWIASPNPRFAHVGGGREKGNIESQSNIVSGPASSQSGPPAWNYPYFGYYSMPHFFPAPGMAVAGSTGAPEGHPSRRDAKIASEPYDHTMAMANYPHPCGFPGALPDPQALPGWMPVPSEEDLERERAKKMTKAAAGHEDAQALQEVCAALACGEAEVEAWAEAELPHGKDRPRGSGAGPVKRRSVGLVFRKRQQQWCIQLWFRTRTHTLCWMPFDEAVNAARARDRIVLHLRGSAECLEKGFLNYPEETGWHVAKLHRLGRAQRRELALQALRRAVLRKPRDLRWKGRDVSS